METCIDNITRPRSRNDELRWGVLFDLDGVIVDSEREYTRIWETINREFPTGVEDFARKIKGTTLDNILNTYFPVRVHPSVMERLYEEEGKMMYRYCPGALGLLKNLRETGIPMALFTSSNAVKMSHLYEDIPDIRDFFDVMVLGDQVTHSKPDPEGYLLAAEGLGLSDGHWVTVEDSLQGAIAGRESGGAVLGVAGTLPQEILAPYCEMVTDSLETVTPEMLHGLLNTCKEH